jgi:hypothetical protein
MLNQFRSSSDCPISDLKGEANMADEQKPFFTETIPSVPGANSGVASASAPVIFFDECPTSGYYNGIAHITCEVMRFHPNPAAGRVEIDRMTAAHLRMNAHALVALKDAIARIEAIMKRLGVPLPPPAEQTPPA